MSNQRPNADDSELAVEVITSQLQHFRNTDPPCKGMQLPDGVLLRHTLSPSLYFYIRTRVEDGKIRSRVFASDSPYERQKAEIGKVDTSMFEPGADPHHLEALEGLIRSWVDFVKLDADAEGDFQSFVVVDRPE